MAKQETIERLTALMATVQMAYRDRIDLQSLRLSESCTTPGQIGIDLYNYGSNPVCEGLKDCNVHFDDDTEEKGYVFAMHYMPDDVTPLTFLVDFDGLPEIQVEPESLPEETLTNITQWLGGVIKEISASKFHQDYGKEEL